MYLLSRTCCTPSMRSSSRSTHSCLAARQRHRRADEQRLAFEHGLHFAQVVGLQRRARGDEVADQIGAAEPRRDLHRAGQRDDVGRDVAFAQVALERERVGGRDALAGDGARAFVAESFGHRQRQAAAAVVERAQFGEGGGVAARDELQALLLEHVAADQAEIADVFLHEIGNVVVAHEQHVERHVLAEAHELVAPARELEAAALEQLERRIGEPSGFLYGELETLFVDGWCHGLQSDVLWWTDRAVARAQGTQAWRCSRLTASE